VIQAHTHIRALPDRRRDTRRVAITGISQHQFARLKLESSESLSGILALHRSEIEMIAL